MYIRSLQPPLMSGTYIPPEMKHKDDGGEQPQAVADNWDHNDHTLDGKRTSHFMTSILVAPEDSGEEQLLQRIPRVQSKCLDANPVEGN